MGLLSGMTSGLLQQTIDGRRVYQLPMPTARSRWPTYLVSDADASMFEARLRRSFILLFAVVIPVLGFSSATLLVFAPAVTPWTWLYWIALVLVLPGIAVHLLLRLWVLRGIPRVDIAPSDMQPVDRRAREIAQLQAMGMPSTVGLVLAGVLMTALQLVVLIEDGVWWAALGTLLIGSATLYMARQIFVLRRATRQSDNSAPS